MKVCPQCLQMVCVCNDQPLTHGFYFENCTMYLRPPTMNPTVECVCGLWTMAANKEGTAVDPHPMLTGIICPGFGNSRGKGGEG